MKKRVVYLAFLLLTVLSLLAGCGQVEALMEEASAKTEVLPIAAEVSAGAAAGKSAEVPAEIPAEETGPITEPQAIADYLFEHGELPDNFITKAEAQALGWDSSRNYLSDVAPGKSIGGDRFGNYEGQLPKAKGRKFFECDANYKGGRRGAERLIYSNDGHVWYTKDHYGTFEELFPSD